MKIALIHYGESRLINEAGNRSVLKHFGYIPSIQLLYVAAVFEQLDVDLLYIDMVGMEVSDSELEKRLKKFQPDLIGFSVFTSHFHVAVYYSGYIKSFLPESKILMGGVHASIFPIETLEYISTLDFLCVGEAEMVMPEFVRRWKNNETFEGLRGLVWRDGYTIKYAGQPCLNRHLDNAPFPARHLVPNEKYFTFFSTRRNYTVFNSSRGCPFSCIFCEAAQSRWRPRSPCNIVDEFEECYEKYGIKEIDIYDSSFTIKKQRVLDICSELIKRGLQKKIVWVARSRVDCIDMEMLEAMKEAGCYRICYGLESGNTEILKTLRKKASIEQMRDIILKTNKTGISMLGYFLVGSPGETHETFRQTINLAKSLPLDFATFASLIPLPKTQLYEKYYVSRTNNDFWADYIKSPKPIENFMGRPWTDIDDSEIRKMETRAILEFYCRPTQLFKVAKSIASSEQFLRYLRMGLEMAVSYSLGKFSKHGSESGPCRCMETHE